MDDFSAICYAMFFGLMFTSWFFSCNIDEHIEEIKERIEETIDFKADQRLMSIHTKNGKRVKGYLTQKDALRNRKRLQAGDVIYLPNGLSIPVKEGIDEVKSDGWWYAWTTLK